MINNAISIPFLATETNQYATKHLCFYHYNIIKTVHFMLTAIGRNYLHFNVFSHSVNTPIYHIHDVITLICINTLDLPRMIFQKQYCFTEILLQLPLTLNKSSYFTVNSGHFGSSDWLKKMVQKNGGSSPNY